MEPSIPPAEVAAKFEEQQQLQTPAPVPTPSPPPPQPKVTVTPPAPVSPAPVAAAAESPPKSAPKPVAAEESGRSGVVSEGSSPRSNASAQGAGDAVLRAQVPKGKAFTEALDEDALAFFNDLTEKPFSEQAVAFLNAYWEEVGSQAEFIFTVAWETIKYADMHTKGVDYIHLYKEGNDLDFNVGLYFYEKLCKKVLQDDEGKRWREDPKYATSMPTMMTAIVRKKELREKVDCNFDGRVSFLEYLLYQYQDEANPKDFTHRAMKHEVGEHPEITKAKQALHDVSEAIRKFEAEKQRLEDLAAKPGVKGLGAKHQLAILHVSPLAEDLNKALITAEAAVRIATRKFSGAAVSSGNAATGEGVSAKPTAGSIWWLNRDLQAKNELYGRKKSG